MPYMIDENTTSYQRDFNFKQILTNQGIILSINAIDKKKESD